MQGVLRKCTHTFLAYFSESIKDRKILTIKLNPHNLPPSNGTPTVQIERLKQDCVTSLSLILSEK